MNDPVPTATPRIDHQLVTPLYHQVYVVLRENIRNGAYPPGRAIPTEHELCRLFGVSRVTIQRAMEHLVGEGLVVRQRGRGSHVVERSAPDPGTGHAINGLIERVAAIGAKTTGRIVEYGYVVPPESVREALRLAPGEQAQKSIHTRSIKEDQFGLITTFVPADIGKAFAPADIERTPMLLLLERAGISVARADQAIGATLADPVTAPLLGTSVGMPLVKVFRLLQDATGRPVEHLTALYRADTYEVRSVLLRDRETPDRAWEVG